MGLFKRAKKRPSKQPRKQPADVAEQVFDEEYRESLRQMGRQHFKRLLEQSSVDMKGDIDAIMEQMTGSLRRHMASQLDLAITRINNDISNQLSERMSEYNRVSGESQELVIQSLSRNAQLVHEKYQQMSSNLQQVVANQEVMMVGVFQESQAKVSAIGIEQDKSLEQLRSSVAEASRQSSELIEQLRQSAHQQSETLNSIYRETSEGASQMKHSQEAAIRSLEQAVEDIKQQQGRLQQMIDESISRQKTLAAELVSEHLASIVEHYVIGALGERSDLAKDLPNILERMQEHKQAMKDDMSL